MKIAIHNVNKGYSTRWIEYCERMNINYKLVNCFETDIFDKILDCDILLWHYYHNDHKDMMVASKILFALEHSGIKVFPNFYTAWHFDDKIAQKYLLEAIGAPHVPSYVFYDKTTAIEWAIKTSYPKVFKLKGGAGSANVKLVKTRTKCISLIRKAFGKGFSQFEGRRYFLDIYKKYKSGKKSSTEVLKAFGRIFISTEFSKKHGREKGYAYFQEFIQNNDSDIRIIIVGKKAFGIKRYVRKGDFRASGSGSIDYSVESIDIRCVAIAFQVNKKIKSQSIAFDFVFDRNNNPLIVEISYGFSISAYDKCEGYWTEDFQFHRGNFNPQAWMVEQIIDEYG